MIKFHVSNWPKTDQVRAELRARKSQVRVTSLIQNERTRTLHITLTHVTCTLRQMKRTVLHRNPF